MRCCRACVLVLKDCDSTVVDTEESREKWLMKGGERIRKRRK